MEFTLVLLTQPKSDPELIDNWAFNDTYLFMDQYHFLFKFVLLGDSSVGKSCLLLQFTEKKFREEYDPTIGVEFGSQIINLEEKMMKLQIWDTAGLESFRSITRSYYKGAIGALIVFDLTNKNSFLNVQSWHNDILQVETRHQTIFLVGNKADLDNERQVTSEEAKNFAEKHKLTYFETSAKNGLNMNLVFEACAHDVFGKIKQNLIDLSSDVFSSLSLKFCGVKLGELAKKEEKLLAGSEDLLVQFLKVQKQQEAEKEQQIDG